MEKSDKVENTEKSCETEKCTKPECANQDPAKRGPGTSKPMSEFKDGKGCPEFEPKLIGKVDMGENSVINLKIARTGVRGNRVRTDRCALILEDLLDQATLDRHALRILRYSKFFENLKNFFLIFNELIKPPRYQCISGLVQR